MIKLKDIPVFLGIVMCVLWWVGCEPKTTYIPSYVPPAQERLVDDRDITSLTTAIDRSIAYYRKVGNDKQFCYRERCHRASELIAALDQLRVLVNEGGENWADMERKIEQNFDVVPATSTLTVTGYFEPIVKGSLTRDERFRYPIYRVPDDHVVVKLGKFDRKYGNETLVGRLTHQELVPYYTRKEIDIDGVLANRGLEIVWVDDPVELFFLHIQGSGTICLPDGSSIKVSYAQSNGRSFRHIATYMVEKGLLQPNDTSHRAIKAFLVSNPSLREGILCYNERYIFFRIVTEGPVGALGIPVVADRSVALDSDVYPKGVPFILKSRKPVKFQDGRPTSWEPFTRIVFHHDIGTAIKGPNRLDLFCGTGPEKELEAGSLKEKGQLFILLPKR